MGNTVTTYKSKGLTIKKWLKRLWGALKRTIKNLVTEGKPMIWAGSLTYSTIMGLVPFCAVFFVLLNSSNPIAEISEFIAPTMENLLTKFFNVVHNYTQSNGLFVAFGSIICIFFSYFLFQSIQRNVNTLMGIPHRPFFSKDEPFYWIFSIASISVLVIIWNYMLHLFASKAIRIILSLILVWAFLLLAFIFTPNTKKKGWIDFGDAIVTSFLSSISLTLIWSFLPLIAKLKNVAPPNQAFNMVILSMFMLWLSWTIVLTCVKLYCELQESEKVESRQEAKDLAPVYKDYLCVMATYYVIKYFHENKYTGPTFEIIKEQMIPNLTLHRDEQSIVKHHSVSLLEETLGRLIERKILNKDGGTYKPATKKNYWELTISDILNQLYIEGDWHLEDAEFTMISDLDRYLKSFLSLTKSHNKKILSIITDESALKGFNITELRDIYIREAKPMPEEIFAYSNAAFDNQAVSEDSKEIALKYGTPEEYLKKLNI